MNGHILVFHPYTTKLEPHCTAQIPLANRIPRSLLLHASRLVYKSERTEKKKTKKQKNRVPRLVKYLFYLWVHIEGENLNSNKLLDLAGRTLKYGHAPRVTSTV